MNQLIPIKTNDRQEPIVSARDLHNFLEIGTHFKDWFPRMVEYGFTENIDYTPLIFEHPQNGQPTIDYVLKLDMAKELSMIQRNDKGKDARQYFIAVEKEFNSPEKIMARALRYADETIHRLTATIEKDKPKVLFADSVSASKTSILIGDLAKLIKQNGHEIGQNRLFEYLRQNGYLIKARGTSYNMPTQRAMEQGLFEIKETVISHSDGHTTINKTPKVTGKGQIYFVNKFRGGELNSIAR